MSNLWIYLLVFVLAATPMFEVFTVVPLGILAGLPSFPVSIVAFLGNALTVFLLIVFIERLKLWWKKKRGGPEGEEKDSKRKLRAKKLWNRYGIPGLSLLGPILVGSHLTALMGISFGASRQRILAWMGISLSIWTIISAVLAHLGFHFIIPEEQRNIRTQWLK